MHDQTKSGCLFYSKLGYCEGVVEELGGSYVQLKNIGGKNSVWE